jgi:hypothetical protein
MLANLLPGIRQVRTPLATGYVWLLTFWLWIPEQLKNTAPSDVPADIMRVVLYAGRIAEGIAISFAAYLIGALSEPLSVPFTQLGALVAAIGTSLTWPVIRFRAHTTSYRINDILHLLRFRYRLRIQEDDKRFSVENISVSIGQFSSVGINDLMKFSSQSVEKGLIRPDAKRSYMEYLARQLPGQSNALLGKETELFSAYDRLISEYEFRVGITVPLSAFIITLAVRWSALWLLMLPPLLILLGTGASRRMRAGDLLVVALRRGGLEIAPPSYLTSDADRKHPPSYLTPDADREHKSNL